MDDVKRFLGSLTNFKCPRTEGLGQEHLSFFFSKNRQLARSVWGWESTASYGVNWAGQSVKSSGFCSKKVLTSSSRHHQKLFLSFFGYECLPCPCYPCFRGSENIQRGAHNMKAILNITNESFIRAGMRSYIYARGGHKGWGRGNLSFSPYAALCSTSYCCLKLHAKSDT